MNFRFAARFCDDLYMRVQNGAWLLWVVAAGCGDVVSDKPDAAVVRMDTNMMQQIDAPPSAVVCQALTNPAYGTVATTNNGNYPSTATYTCAATFMMVGNATRTCAMDGTWSDAAPTCMWTGARAFTNCAQTGGTGPSQAQCDTAYTGTTLASSVTVAAGIQQWTVPADGTYRITASGASGGTIGGWLGARMQGDFVLTEGTVLKILVGQLPTGSLSGGGGSFVTQMNNTPLVIAGGGGSGNCATYCVAAESGGRAVTTGGTMTGVTRSTAGVGGSSGNTVSGGGGGLTGDGQNGGKSFVNGGAGAVGETGYIGGFGGGGARNGGNGCGAGGGYSGGSANSNGTDTTMRFGGGGGSFNAGNNPVNTPNINNAVGSVTIDLL
jgi:hypothetical protein